MTMIYTLRPVLSSFLFLLRLCSIPVDCWEISIFRTLATC